MSGGRLFSRRVLLVEVLLLVLVLIVVVGVGFVNDGPDSVSDVVVNLSGNGSVSVVGNGSSVGGGNSSQVGQNVSSVVNVSSGSPESKNGTVTGTPTPSVSLILNPYEKYKPPVKLANYKNHYVFVVEYFDADSQPCLELERVLVDIFGKDSVWVRMLNDNYDNKVRHDYVTRILLGRYYSYYVVPITAIFVDDKLAVVFTGSWSRSTVEKFVDWYVKNDFVSPGRFLFIDITEAQDNYGQVVARLINSRVKYNALIDLFLQQGVYKYDRIHVLAMS